MPAEARVRIHRYRVGDARLLAFERNVDYQMSENLQQTAGNEFLEKPIELEATLAEPAFVYDLGALKFLAQTNRVRFKLDPWQPTFVVLWRERIPPAELLTTLTAAQ